MLTGEVSWVRPCFDATTDSDRQETDLITACVRRDDFYQDRRKSGVRASRPSFDEALDALRLRHTLVITTLDRLGRSTPSILAFSEELKV